MADLLPDFLWLHVFGYQTILERLECVEAPACSPYVNEPSAVFQWARMRCGEFALDLTNPAAIERHLTLLEQTIQLCDIRVCADARSLSRLASLDAGVMEPLLRAAAIHVTPFQLLFLARSIQGRFRRIVMHESVGFDRSEPHSLEKFSAEIASISRYNPDGLRLAARCDADPLGGSLGGLIALSDQWAAATGRHIPWIAEQTEIHGIVMPKDEKFLSELRRIHFAGEIVPMVIPEPNLDIKKCVEMCQSRGVTVRTVIPLLDNLYGGALHGDTLRALAADLPPGVTLETRFTLWQFTPRELAELEVMFRGFEQGNVRVRGTIGPALDTVRTISRELDFLPLDLCPHNMTISGTASDDLVNDLLRVSDGIRNLKFQDVRIILSDASLRERFQRFLADKLVSFKASRFMDPDQWDLLVGAPPLVRVRTVILKTGSLTPWDVMCIFPRARYLVAKWDVLDAIHLDLLPPTLDIVECGKHKFARGEDGCFRFH